MLRPFIDRFYEQRDRLANPLDIPIQDPVIKRTRTYFVPGFLNHTPHPGFLARLGQASQNGLAFVSVSDEAHYFDEDGYTLIGGKKKVYHPDWRHELATIIKRIYVDLMEQQAKGTPAEQNIFIGHSKGGLLIHSLAAFVKAEQTGHLGALRAYFPRLSDLPDAVLLPVLKAAAGATYLAIGTPFDGLNERTLRIAENAGFERLFGKTAHYFTRRFLEAHYRITDLDPADPDFGIHAVITGQPFDEESPVFWDFINRALLRARPSRRSVFYYGGVTLYDLGAILLGSDLNHDGLVTPSARRFAESLHLMGYNHVTLVGPNAADHVIEVLAKMVAPNESTQ